MTWSEHLDHGSSVEKQSNNNEKRDNDIVCKRDAKVGKGPIDGMAGTRVGRGRRGGYLYEEKKRLEHKKRIA